MLTSRDPMLDLDPDEPVDLSDREFAERALREARRDHVARRVLIM
nr:hypothetical protein [uncultured Gellertiella sp.]